MYSAVDSTIASIQDYLSDIEDTRTNDLFLGSSPYPTLALIAWYLIMVKYVFPAFMRNRPAYSLSRVLFYYNTSQVLLNAYLFYMSIIASGYGRRFSIFKCRELDQSTTDPDAIAALQAIHHFYLSKFTEFFDTFFFLLRKKDSQITFLHLYHHATMPLNTWIALRYGPGGSCTLGAGINSSVHVVMYAYYLLSGLGPSWQKYTWWKKYLTTLQIVQFFSGFILVYVHFSTSSACPILFKRFPFLIYGLAYVLSLLLLFSRFYIHAYHSKKKL